MKSRERKSVATAKQAKAVAEPYCPSPREQDAFRRYEEKAWGGVPLISMESDGPGDPRAPRLRIGHKDPDSAARLWMVSLGTYDPRFADAITGQLANLSMRNGEFSVDQLNQHLAFVQNVRPENVLETALATQMAAVHSASMDMARRLSTATTFQQIEAYERGLNKLTRTFATQMETLKKVRSKGEQKVIVEHQHVHVHPGGQAVVGNVTHGVGGEGSIQNEGQPHERSEPVRIPERSAVPCDVQADQVQVPRTGSVGLDSVPVSRSPRRAALRAVE